MEVKWTKNDGSKDNFAVQVDVLTRNASPGPALTTPKAGTDPVATTKKADPGPVATTPKIDPGPVGTTKKADPVGTGVSTSPRPAVEPTTSGIQSLTLLISSTVIFLASFR